MPWIFVCAGILLLTYGTFGPFDDTSKVSKYLIGLGTSILASGVFAAVLKSMQLMDVFRKDLLGIIYEARYLEGRNDLEDIWERVSKIMFKDKFPKISREVMHDVKKIYFPTESVLYYDNYDQTLEIELLDEASGMIKVTQHSSYIVYTTDSDKPFDHKTTNTIIFNKDRAEVTFSIIEYKVNGEDKTPMQSEISDGNKLKTFCIVQLSGATEYKFQTTIEKTYSLHHDSEIGVMKDFIIHDFKLKVLLTGNLKIRFCSVGTLKSFQPKTFKRANCYEYEYRGIIYPKQGYLMCIEKKH
ncbi:hypothetical protein [Taibaiella koreensis]|uniref:hypothetical protein n=1 Tax=Taibaiella koreensis TaxID=1268548 RepID=UPI000E59CCB2|nr:hypothetical protein [Taibaiella koreensis]